MISDRTSSDTTRKTSLELLRSLIPPSDWLQHNETHDDEAEEIIFKGRLSTSEPLEILEAETTNHGELTRPRSDSTSSDGTTESNEVDWTELAKTEESEVKDEGSDEVRRPSLVDLPPY